MKVFHTLKPIYNANSKILILGSMPSIVSRNAGFYYVHKTNRFWRILEIVFNVSLNTVDEKTNFLLKNNIALWDTIFSCDIKSSSDVSIKNIEVNDINYLIANSNIKYIFCAGRKAYDIFVKNFDFKNVFCLPSPSSANASKSLDDLVQEYKILKKYLKY